MDGPLLHRNIQKQTDIETENTIYYNFKRFRDYSTEPDSKKNSLVPT